jgi:hypothetical protein
MRGPASHVPQQMHGRWGGRVRMSLPCRSRPHDESPASPNPELVNKATANHIDLVHSHTTSDTWRPWRMSAVKARGTPADADRGGPTGPPCEVRRQVVRVRESCESPRCPAKTDSMHLTFRSSADHLPSGSTMVEWSTTI